ncbi:MAG: class I SAM-dependent methyltransferase [Bdellovibrio sp.]|nr:class I SAM-dependent methyltransferase [Bdellovibrio sp.]
MDKEIENNKEQKLNDDLVLPQEKLDKIDHAYSSDPWWYDLRGFLILTFAYRTTLPAQIRLFANHIGERHLEGAIGTGTLFEMILKWRKWKNRSQSQIIGYDYAERMLAGARKRFKKEKQLRLLRADAAALPLPADYFDTAAIANAIHCLPDVAGSFKEFHRVLKPNGLLTGNCLLEPKGNGFFDHVARRINTWGIQKGILHRPYQADEVIELLKSTGFEIAKQEIAGNCLNFVAKKTAL